MLENAGVNVFTPRERDTQKQEVIVDNDGSRSGHGGQGSLYLDVKSRKARWEQTLSLIPILLLYRLQPVKNGQLQ